MEAGHQSIKNIDVASGPSESLPATAAAADPPSAHIAEAVADPVTEDSETSAPAGAAPFEEEEGREETDRSSQPLPDIFELTYCFIRHTSTKNGKRSRGPDFAFIGSKAKHPISMFGNQVIRLTKELPKAYKAYQNGDSSYRYVLCEDKSNLIALEVSYYNEKNYLFLKKYFKPSPEAANNATFLAASAVVINDSPWLPTRGVVGLDPAKDKPQEMLAFVLSCCQ